MESEFKRLKTERDRLKVEFDSAQAEHMRLKEVFQRKLEEIKAQNQQARERILDKANIRWPDRKDAKIVKKADGTTQIYSGGLGNGDGPGHGHVVLDGTNHKTYDRDAFAKHGSQNFTDNSFHGWAPYERGVIDDHKVTFRQGLGSYSGQTLIRDGHVSGKEFDRHHNHYGVNDKGRFPDEPNRIEDSSRHKDDIFYTGPGH